MTTENSLMSEKSMLARMSSCAFGLSIDGVGEKSRASFLRTLYQTLRSYQRAFHNKNADLIAQYREILNGHIFYRRALEDALSI